MNWLTTRWSGLQARNGITSLPSEFRLWRQRGGSGIAGAIKLLAAQAMALKMPSGEEPSLLELQRTFGLAGSLPDSEYFTIVRARLRGLPAEVKLAF